MEEAKRLATEHAAEAVQFLVMVARGETSASMRERLDASAMLLEAAGLIAPVVEEDYGPA